MIDFVRFEQTLFQQCCIVTFFSNVIIFRSVVSSIETRLTKTTKLKNVVIEKKMDEKQRRMKRRIEVEREEKGRGGVRGSERKTQGCSLESGSRTLVRLAVEFE